MAEELKNQTAERLPAAVRIMADAMFPKDPQATKKLFKMMEEGKLDPNTALPKFAMGLEARAAGGWDKYTQTSRYKQNIAQVELENQFMAMNASGGTSGWFKIWSTFAETLPKMRPLFIAAGQGFDFLAGKFQGLGDVIGAFGSIVGQIQKITSSTEDMYARVGQLAPFLAAFWKRAFAPLYGAYLIIQDIAGYSMGMKSVTGMAFDFMQGKNGKSDTTPTALKRDNPYAGQVMGGGVFEAQKEYEAKRTGLSALKYYNYKAANWVLERHTRPFIDAATWLFSPNTDSSSMRLTPEAQMMSTINNVAYGGMGGKGVGIPNFDITIHAQTNDPQELANLVTKTITNQAVPFLLRNNGE